MSAVITRESMSGCSVMSSLGVWEGHIFLSRTEEPAKAGTCARDRRSLQQLALNVHVKHSDLT